MFTHRVVHQKFEQGHLDLKGRALPLSTKLSTDLDINSGNNLLTTTGKLIKIIALAMQTNYIFTFSLLLGGYRLTIIVWHSCNIEYFGYSSLILHWVHSG